MDGTDLASCSGIASPWPSAFAESRSFPSVDPPILTGKDAIDRSELRELGSLRGRAVSLFQYRCNRQRLGCPPFGVSPASPLSHKARHGQKLQHVRAPACTAALLRTTCFAVSVFGVNSSSLHSDRCPDECGSSSPLTPHLPVRWCGTRPGRGAGPGRGKWATTLRSALLPRAKNQSLPKCAFLAAGISDC